VVRVIPNYQKNGLVSQALDLPPYAFEVEPLVRQPLPGLHRRTRAFIKGQDGCDNHCTFCITTLARGPGISRSAPDVLSDIRSALAGGVQEIVLTGVHLGSWGYDFGSHLQDLVRLILRETDVPRLRLSSLEPWDLEEKFFSLWADNRLMPHLHLPLQSGCTGTLKRMARKTTPASFRKLVTAARRSIEDLSITTDVIVGFPGETDAEFTESLEFIREMNFSGGHVFSYSPRPGTAAARLDGRVSRSVLKERSQVLRQVLDTSATENKRTFIGRVFPVLWESTTAFGESGWLLSGYSPNYMRVKAYAQTPRWNEVDLVRTTEMSETGLQGVILNSG
jgi:threonylcarbamoyladenosine tRNA methylthiotransferase MtaB